MAPDLGRGAPRRVRWGDRRRTEAEKGAEEARDLPPAAGIFLHRPERPKTVRIEGPETVRVETGPEGVEVHLDG
jgi:hypothetical protein